MTPTSWKAGKVSDFIVLQRGFDLTKDHSVEGNVPVYSSSGISYFHNVTKVKGPGVVTGRKGKVGKVYYVDGDYWPHDTTLWVKDFKGNSPKYVKHFLDFLRLERFDEASSVPTVNRNNVHGFRCIFPPPEEQDAIAHIIEKWDLAIEKAGKLLNAVDMRHQALSQRLVDWSISLSSINTVIEPISRPISKPKTPYWALGIRSHGKGTFRRFVEDPASVAMDTLYQVRHCDLIVNITFAWEGATALVDSKDDDCLVSHRFPTFEVKKSVALPDYLRHVIVQKRFIHDLGVISPGGAGRNRVLNQKDFLKLRIPVPRIEDQQKIGNILNTSQIEISLLEKKLDLLKKHRRGLMQKLLTGEWRVKSHAEVT